MTEPPAFHTSAIPTASQGDLASAVAAMESHRKDADGPTRHRTGRPARRARRAALALVFVALLIGGVVNLVPAPDSESADGGTRASIVFGNAQAGACLNWPPDSPDKPSFVQCRAEHMFEVATPLGADGSAETCQLAVREYYGARYDPNGKFATTVLGTGDAGGVRVGDGKLLCGLQLPGPGGRPVAFRGSVGELDQSKVWPVGTCLGIDSSNRATDVVVECTAPHALEVTGAVSLAQRFGDETPSESNQRAFLGGVCSQLADVYLAPGTWLSSGLTLAYEPLSPASWTAGSRQVACSVGRRGGQGWTPVVGSARSQPAAPTTAAPATTSDAPPPPVYQEPLIPIGPVPTEAPPSPAPEPAPEPAPTSTAPPEPEPPPVESPAPQPGAPEIPDTAPVNPPEFVPSEPVPPLPG